VAVPWLAGFGWLCWDVMAHSTSFSFDILLTSLFTAVLGATIGVFNSIVITVPLAVVTSVLYGRAPVVSNTLWFRFSFAIVTALAGWLWALVALSALDVTQGRGALLVTGTVAGLCLGLLTPAVWRIGRSSTP
jgi:hypothetical protein